MIDLIIEAISEIIEKILSLFDNKLSKTEATYLTMVESLDTFVPSSLVMAIIKQESNFRPYAYGRSAEYGLMQIMCDTARDMGFRDECKRLFNPLVNILFGTRYLEYQFNRYRNWESAISAYNAGHATTVNQKYVDSVLRFWNSYKMKGV